MPTLDASLFTVIIIVTSKLHQTDSAFASAVSCKCCGHTHAVLLSSMVPHSQISLAEHVTIINNYEKSLSHDSVINDNPSIDEGCCRYIIKQYLKHWKQKLLSEHIFLNSLPDLTASCLSLFSCQFMQIKRLPNVLFLNTT